MRNGTVPPHRPDRKTSVIRVLPNDVAETGPVKITDSANLPIQPDCCDSIIRKNGRAVHVPDADFAGLYISPEDILFPSASKSPRELRKFVSVGV